MNVAIGLIAILFLPAMFLIMSIIYFSYYLFCELKKIKMTNLDKIRCMTKEELANFLVNDTDIFCEQCPLKYSHCDGKACEDTVLKWLEQPMEENKNGRT